MSLLTEAYQRRDHVALIAFRATGASVALPLTSSVELAHTHLRDLPTGGRTPLAAGLDTTITLLRQVQRREPDRPAVVVLMTDGRANVALADGDPVDEAIALAQSLGDAGAITVVIDTENDFISFGLARRIADAAHGQYVRIADLSADSVAANVRSVLSGTPITVG